MQILWGEEILSGAGHVQSACVQHGENGCFHLSVCAGVSFSLLSALNSEGCKSQKVLDRHKQMMSEREAERVLALRASGPDSDLATVASPSSQQCIVPSKRPRHEHSSSQPSIAASCYTVNDSMAATILFFITRWLLGTATSFRNQSLSIAP